MLMDWLLDRLQKYLALMKVKFKIYILHVLLCELTSEENKSAHTILFLSSLSMFEAGVMRGKTDRMYQKKCHFTYGSNVVYFERTFIEYFLSNYHQGWMSQDPKLRLSARHAVTPQKFSLSRNNWS